VTLIGLDDGSQLSGLQRIVENDASLEDGEPSDSNDSNPEATE
jgi:DNA gyrase subunit A